MPFWTSHLWMFWLNETTPTLATDRTCLLMAWLEVFAVAMVMVSEVSFMPSSLPEGMQNVKPCNRDLHQQKLNSVITVQSIYWSRLNQDYLYGCNIYMNDSTVRCYTSKNVH